MCRKIISIFVEEEKYTTMVNHLVITLCACACICMSCSEESASNEIEDTGTPMESASASDASSGGGTTVSDMPWTFLVDGILHNNATITSGQSPGKNINAGKWIDFKENGTYDYGTYDKREFGGTWYYDGDTEILELTPEGERRPSEWTIKYKDNNLIWIGTNKYGNNATQMRWLRRTGYPEAPGN